MKITECNNKSIITLSHKEWTIIGKSGGWIKKTSYPDISEQARLTSEWLIKLKEKIEIAQNDPDMKELLKELPSSETVDKLARECSNYADFFKTDEYLNPEKYDELLDENDNYIDEEDMLHAIISWMEDIDDKIQELGLDSLDSYIENRGEDIDQELESEPNFSGIRYLFKDLEDLEDSKNLKDSEED